MKLPILLTSKTKKQFYENKFEIDCLGVTSGSSPELHGAISYCVETGRYRFTALGDVFVNGLKAPKVPLGYLLATVNEKRAVIESVSKEIEIVYLDDLSQIMVEKGSKNDDVDIFYFTVPNMTLQTIQKFEPKVVI